MAVKATKIMETQIILKHLKKEGAIAPFEAFKLYNIPKSRLRNHINQLIRSGYEIIKDSHYEGSMELITYDLIEKPDFKL